MGVCGVVDVVVVVGADEEVGLDFCFREVLEGRVEGKLYFVVIRVWGMVSSVDSKLIFFSF